MTWVEDIKDSGSWDFESQDDWKGNIDLGPWSFEPQPDKLCYNEGNRLVCADQGAWTLEGPPGILGTIHHPFCGYWSSRPAIVLPQVNIYGLFVGSPYDQIYGAYFNGKKLKLIALYEAFGEQLSGLAQYRDVLVTIANYGATASVRMLDPATLTLREEINPFNEYDFTTSYKCELVGSDVMFFVSPNDHTLIKLQGLTRVGRGFIGTVVEGTDGDLYRTAAYYAGWDFSAHPLNYRPVTGANWADMWAKIPDGICDSPVVNWGEGICYPGNNSLVLPYFEDNQLYLSYFASPNSRIREFDPSSLEIEESGNTSYGQRLLVHGSKIYVLQGCVACRIGVYDKDTLAHIETGDWLPSGRTPGDLIIMDNHLMVITAPYSPGYGGLYKIDLGSLEIKDSLIFGEHTPYSYQRLCAIDERYVAAGRETGVSVFDIEHMVLVDDVGIPGSLAHDHTDLVVM